ncbi:MAG: hypothetical protein WAL63_03730 [Solirubrobacteraceae bacterium]
MWLVLIAVPILVLLVLGGLLAGGVYAIVLVPIAVVIGVGAVIYLMWGQATRASHIPSEQDRVQPLPHTGHANAAATPSTPDQLVDARQQEQ